MCKITVGEKAAINSKNPFTCVRSVAVKLADINQ